MSTFNFGKISLEKKIKKSCLRDYAAISVIDLFVYVTITILTFRVVH